MVWQTLIILQIIASSLLVIWTRHVSVRSRKSAFGVGLISYGCVAVMGFVYSILHSRALPVLPHGIAWLYILAEGLLIPASWLFQFKLVSHIGASNAVISSTFNSLGAAFLGIILLGETITVSFVFGTLLVMGGIYLAFIIKPDEQHPVTATFNTKALLLIGAVVCFSFGMFFEKKAIGAIGVWNYAMFGWAMQFVGAMSLYLIFGRKEISSLPKKVWHKAMVLGLMTSVAGLFYILALSVGTLSHTVVATSGKIAITMVLAAIFLHERNNMPLRIGAFSLAMLGILFIMI